MADPRLTAAEIDPALQPLIEQLAGNAAPTTPGAWPPPPLAWLGLVLLIALAAAGLLWYRRTRIRRRYLRALAAVRHLSDAQQRLSRLHAVLRNAAGERDPSLRALPDTEFARQVAEALGLERAPDWVNAHYRPNAEVVVDWSQARALVRRWCA